MDDERADGNRQKSRQRRPYQQLQAVCVKIGIERCDHGRGHHEQGEDGRYLTRTLAGDDFRPDQKETKEHDSEHGQQLLENDAYQSGAALLSRMEA